MIDLSRLHACAEYRGVDRERFRDAIQPMAKPALLRGLVATWPAVQRARESDAALCDYLQSFDNGTLADGCFGHAVMGGRYFYDADLRGFNFERRRVAVSDLLQFLLAAKRGGETIYGYAGAVRMHASLPGLRELNPSPLIAPEVEQLNSVWIGNRSRVSAHWDLPQNLICAVGGRRRYILFPPDQLANLYCGPLDFTPAGQPISLIDFHAPDLARFPRFALALEHAQLAELEPGDALYLPSLWWHHAESLDPIGVMINDWWREQPAQAMSPKSTLLHALMTLRDLPDHERAAWREFFDHYVFAGASNVALGHIPIEARGVLGAMTPELAAQLRAQLARSLQW